ncbi:MAG: DNA-binding protein [Hyphomicrobiales bacterium]|nr:MAG: DNA-binding protein [Hyphomicrobiales bacterium]
MLSHERVWAAIDRLAARHGFSPSGLARQAGLDPTTFNKSKRVSREGRQRWPSTESISKVLEATGEPLDSFLTAVNNEVMGDLLPQQRTVPLLGFAQAGAGGFFDDGGFPAGSGWDEVEFPKPPRESAYALEVAGDSMLPLYRDGDIIIVAPGEPLRRGDRVVVKTNDGEVMAKILYRQTARSIDLQSLNPSHEDRSFSLSEIEWIARIIWASQ